VMRSTHDAIAITAAVTDQLHRKVMEADIISDLLKRTMRDERRDTINPGLKAFISHSRSNRYHILLGDTRIDELLVKFIAHTFQCHIAKVARDKHHLP